MDHEVRRIRADEWRQYRELRLEALQDAPLAFLEQYSESLARPDQFWRERVERGAGGPVSSMFAAVQDGRFTGKASSFVEEEITDHVSAQIVGVYVTPPLRGQGVAEAVVGAAVRWAWQEARADRVRLYVVDNNPRAEAFYRRLGFTRTGFTIPYPPDPTYTEHEMALAGPE